jgi:acyl-coenzyme A synthetase/AMP-(fatty) acid ligase
LGHIDDRGELVLLGRTGRSIKVAGRRLNPVEIEGILRTVSGVREAFVAPHPGRPDVLVAAVAGSLSGEQVRAALGARLAPWKIPRRIVVLPQFPVTLRGKPDTRRLLALLEG